MHRLNERQKKILKFIVDFYQEKRYPAIIQDIEIKFNIKNGSVRSTVATLAKYGYIDWITERGRTRALFPLCSE